MKSINLINKWRFTLVGIFIFILSLSTYSQSSPNIAIDPPNKLCYDYDIAGNRIGQNPAWIQPEYNPEIGCTPNDPENTKSNFGGKIILFKDVAQLDVLGSLTKVRWALNLSDVPIGLWGSGIPVLNPTSWAVMNNPHDDYMVVFDFGNVVKGTLPIRENNILDITIVPNPNYGQFKIEQKGFNPESSEIIIIDSRGAILMKRDYATGFVNVGEFSNGQYILILTDKQNTVSTRFVKH